MSEVEVLRAKFSDLNTSTLRDMWATEARASWAEKILREELVSRDVPATELDGVALRRDEIASSAPPSARDTVWKYGYVGRLLAFSSALAAFLLVRALLGARLGVCAAILVFAGYVILLVRRVLFQSQFAVSGWTMFAMVWQCIEAVLFLVGFVLVVVMMPAH
jgi:hypothetical protein